MTSVGALALRDVSKRARRKNMSNFSNEFDWDKVAGNKGFGQGYSVNELTAIEQQIDLTMAEMAEGVVRQGVVVGINERDVIVNIGFKSDGMVPRAEFKDYSDLKIGDVVDVFVETQEDKKGELRLSHKAALVHRAWEKVKEAQEQDAAIEGLVKRRTKGGLIMDIFGIEAFLPGSQIDVKPVRDFDIYVGKRMEVKVVKINSTNDNVVVSHKILVEKDLEDQRSLILNNLEKGQVLEGVIKNMTSFGVFIDLGGVDGLLHITDISWERINHPEEMLQLDQKVQVVVLDFDEDRKRISLGMKQLTPHPWTALAAEIEAGSKVGGKVVNVADYGAFIEILPGVEGLIHVSEMSWSQHLRNPSDFLKMGDEIEAVVLTIDREERRMSLGIKQLTSDPWTRPDMLNKYAKGTRHTGVVRNLTTFGLFLELEEGIDGLVHVSDLSWTKRIKHPSEFVKVNENLEVIVLEINADDRRLSLGHKQIEPNPWDTFETVFFVGSLHKGTITAKVEKGVTMELPYGIEGFAITKNLTKEDGTTAEVGEALDFRVLEFNKDERRIVVSHLHAYKEMEAAPATAAKKAKAKPTKEEGGAPANVSNESAANSLADDEGLMALKKALESSK